MSLVHIYEGALLVPHDRTANQSAVIYSSSSTSFTVPTGARAARIVPISGGSILVENGDSQSGTAHACDVASTLLSSSATEHVVPVAKDSPTLKLAGLTGTAVFQLTWVF